MIEQTTLMKAVAISIAVVLCVAEAFKLGVFAAAMPGQLEVDAGHYWQLGKQVSGGDLWMLQNPVAFRTPGYPWFLGAAQSVFGAQALWAIVAVQYIAVFLTTLVTGWWVWRMTRSPWTAIASLAICLISGARASHASSLLTETLFTLFLTLVVMSLTRLAEITSIRRVAGTALLFGVVCLLRPAGLAIAPVWIVALRLSTHGRISEVLRARFRHIAVATIIFTILVGPWVYRNHVVFDRSSLTVFLGRELWISTFGPGSPGPPEIPDTVESRRLKETVLRAGDFDGWDGNWLVSSRLTAAGLSDAEADEAMRTVAVQAIAGAPLRATARGVWRFIDFWRSVYSPRMAFIRGDDQTDATNADPPPWNNTGCQRLRDTWLNAAPERRLLVVELTSVAALVGVFGMCCNPQTWRAGAIIAATVLLVAVSTSALEYPTYRYRMVLEPLLIVGAFSGLQTVAEIMRRGTRSLWEEARSVK